MGTMWVVCDTSGSMLEGGKRLIMRGLVRQVEQFLRLGYGPQKDLKLALWNEEVTTPAWSPNDEVPEELLDCKGSTEGEVLVRFLSSQAASTVLLLTDGFWSEGSRSAIKRWKDSLGPDSLRVIKVGADANPKLNGDEVFDSEDFFSAMGGWLDK